MMRLAAFTVLGWTMTLFADGEADHARPSGAGPVAASESVDVDTPRGAPAQEGDEGTEGPAGTGSSEAAESTAPPVPNPADVGVTIPRAVFFDSFNRSDSDNVSESGEGQTGILAPLEYVEPSDNGAPAQSRIAGGKLVLGNNSVSDPPSHVVLNQNFIFAEMVESGGFKVSLRVGEIAAEADQANDAWLGTGVGLDGAALTDTQVNHVQKNAGLFFALTADDKLRVFQHGAKIGEDISLKTPAPSAGRTILAEFFLDSFDAGSKVNYQLSADGTDLAYGSFVWSGNAKNYIGIDTSTGGAAENFLVALPKTARGRHVSHGWLDDQILRTPKTSLLARILHLVETADQIDADGKMHQKLTDKQLWEIRRAVTEIDHDMQRLLTGDPTIAERDPNKDPIKNPWLTTEEKRELLQRRTVEGQKPKPPLAKTPGVVKKEKEDRVIHVGDGDVGVRTRAVVRGTVNRHGTVIHRSGISRSSGRGARTPRVIEFKPPPQPPAPPAEPEPAGAGEE